MHERHEHEQYFFAPATVQRLASFVSRYQSLCLLCAPTLGAALQDRGRKIAILDIDERFSDLKGYRLWNLYRPTPLGERFDLIVCDPPFYKVTLSQLFAAIQVLSQNSFDQPLLISHLIERAQDVMGAFAPFALQRTGFSPDYISVDQSSARRIEFFSNLVGARL